ncbi:nucleotidyltransferase family protein [Flavihumibacter cheonanensis]|uniref:nucleotidyltransferase family protein n=1 Tax=Flavihumibacter cheonanensis TaxID=1442385 RepID=UPI001EF800E6|nr:nucleotidyltransferase family protein [Flavihumibacter cheonanensis]MCG7753927.1 nucleotidyltransferase family protein [Flavihumibacter cheonanensis]
MKAMIFAAGLGTRFKPWTDQHPKALAPVNGKSLLQRNIEYLQQYGITEVVVNVHHFANQIREAVENANGWGSKILISDERDEVLETGGGLLKAAPLLGNEPFLTINADVLTDLNLDALLQFHQQEKALISFGVTNRKSTRNILFDKQNRMQGWVNLATNEFRFPPESPYSAANALQELTPKAYSTVVVFSPAIFSLISRTGKFSLIDVYLDLAGTHKIMGFDHSGDRFIDVGKPESVAQAEALFD